MGTPHGMVTSSSPRAISNALRLPRAGPLTQSTPRGGDLPSSGSGKRTQARPAQSPGGQYPALPRRKDGLTPNPSASLTNVARVMFFFPPFNSAIVRAMHSSANPLILFA